MCLCNEHMCVCVRMHVFFFLFCVDCEVYVFMCVRLKKMCLNA